MIKIYKYGEVENNEIFSRMADTVDVSDIVTDIIENDGKAELTCQFCPKVYRLDKEELTELLQKA